MTDTSVEQYFTTTLPGQFASLGTGELADQPDFTATYEITGGGTYGIRIVNGQLEVVPGGISGSDLHTTLGLNEWQNAIATESTDPILDYYRRRKVAAVQKLRGLLRLDLTNDDGSPYESTILFGGTDTPEVTLRMKTKDYMNMMRGKLNGQMAFMTGKLKFEGSMPLLMQLGTLSS